MGHEPREKESTKLQEKQSNKKKTIQRTNNSVNILQIVWHTIKLSFNSLYIAKLIPHDINNNIFKYI